MKANLPTTEPAWVEKWKKEDVYGQLRTARKGKPLFVLHDGPPYANGAIHLGTALNKVLKDFVVKTKSMAGFDAPYVPGWDCHGLPIEIKVDQQLGAKKAAMPVLSIRRACREYALKYVGIQRDAFERLGVFGRWSEPYLTLNPAYEAAIAEALLGFIGDGSAYKGLRAVYWCIHDRTALAEAEVEYKNHESQTVWVRYGYAHGTLPNALAGIDGKRLFAAVWTTTPWTLPASMALAFHPELTYVAAKTPSGDVYIAAEARWAATQEAAHLEGAEIVARFAGQELTGVNFRHPWLDRDIPAVLADYITTDQGSGIVHTAPGHGAEDFATGEKYHLPVLCPVDAGGRFFGEETAPFTGETITAANPKIVEHLREVGALLRAAPLAHSYPHCWRCHQPIIFRATEQWFIGMDRKAAGRTQTLREAALEQVHRVAWLPGWGEERIANMVAGRPDWCISRQRVWGVPIPVLSCAHCHTYLRDSEVDRKIIATFAQEGSDSWFGRPAEDFVAAGTACPKCGGTTWTQERDIVDVWFESGSSQAAVLGHSPELPWPADVYLEGGDQYRGWFQSSLLVAVGRRGAAPYKQALTHGWVLDAQGRAMHKSLGNSIEPEEIVSKYGAEVLRLWVASSEYREDVNLSPDMLERLSEAYRKIRNTFRYLLGSLDKFDPARHAVPLEKLWDLDAQMLRQTARMAEEVEREYAAYAFHRAYRRMSDFCTVELSAFYFDILKDRLYTFAPTSIGRRSGLTALQLILDALVRLMAPLLPFTTEEVWAAMGRAGSIHLENFAQTEGWRGSAAEENAAEERWTRLRTWRTAVLAALETARNEKKIGKSLEARVELLAAADDLAALQAAAAELPALFIVSQVVVVPGEAAAVAVHLAQGAKCERCWNHSLAVGANSHYPELCDRCCEAMAEIAAAANATGSIPKP